MHMPNFEAETHHFILSFLGGTFDDVQKYFFPLLVISEKRVNFEIWLRVVFSMQHKVQRNSQTVKNYYYCPEDCCGRMGFAPQKSS